MAGETGRPRNAAVNDAVLGATVALLGERGYQGLRINDVAERSGVAKTTVYRRWPTLTHLVVAAMEHALGQRDIEPTGNLGTDLDRMIRAGYGALVGGGTLWRTPSSAGSSTAPPSSPNHSEGRRRAHSPAGWSGWRGKTIAVGLRGAFSDRQ